MKYPLYQIDTFTEAPFAGNPAAVCLLSDWLNDDLLLAISAENNLSETAFMIARGASYDLRWFTPTIEVALCGHATLAAAYVIMAKLDPTANIVSFMTRQSGELTVERIDDWFWLNMPAVPAASCSVIEPIANALGRTPTEVYVAPRDYLAVFGDEDDIRSIQPSFELLMELDRDGLIVTAPGEKVDFVSRFFAPKLGVLEDPVTGSAHCTLTPYWTDRLSHKELVANQISPRGGYIRCIADDDRVRVGGRCTLYLDGTIDV